MTNQFEHGGIGKVSFRSMLNAAMPIIKTKPFASIDYDELITYARLVQYKVQRDLFALSEAEEPGFMSWQEFVWVVRGNRKLRDSCLDVIGRKLETTFFQYDFTQRELDLPKEINLAVDGMLRGASLFTDDEGLMLMVLFLYFAERAYFNQLQDTVRPDYTWEEYYKELLLAGELWMVVLTAFRNTVMQLDFKETWQEVGLSLE